MTQLEKVALTLNNVELTLEHFNSSKTIILMTHKQTELYNVALHSEGMLLNALNNAVTVRLI